jgi:hypothetical protein
MARLRILRRDGAPAAPEPPEQQPLDDAVDPGELERPTDEQGNMRVSTDNDSLAREIADAVSDASARPTNLGYGALKAKSTLDRLMKRAA